MGTFEVERESRPGVRQVDEGSCYFRVSGSLGKLQTVTRVLATFFGEGLSTGGPIHCCQRVGV